MLGRAFAILIVTPFVLFLGVVVLNEVAIVYTQWRFSSHEVNQKISELMPHWSANGMWTDVIKAFPAATTPVQLQELLDAAGHDCQIAENGAVTKLTCEGFAGYVTWDCSYYLYVTAETGLDGNLSSLTASRYRNCW